MINVKDLLKRSAEAAGIDLSKRNNYALTELNDLFVYFGELVVGTEVIIPVNRVAKMIIDTEISKVQWGKKDYINQRIRQMVPAIKNAVSNSSSRNVEVSDIQSICNLSYSVDITNLDFKQANQELRNDSNSITSRVTKITPVLISTDLDRVRKRVKEVSSLRTIIENNITNYEVRITKPF